MKTGDLLYQIEKVQFQAQLDQAKANLAAAERGAQCPAPVRPRVDLVKRQNIPQAMVDQDKANLDTAKAK